MARMRGNSNSSGFGVPGTQQTAQRNVAGAGRLNPYMPQQPQQARQARSSYQRGLVGGQAPGRAAQAPPRAVVPPLSKAPPATGYQLMAGVPSGELLAMNRSLGISAFTELPGAPRTAQRGVRPSGRPELPTATLMGDPEYQAVPETPTADRGGRPTEGWENPFEGWEVLGGPERPQRPEVMQETYYQTQEPPPDPFVGVSDTYEDPDEEVAGWGTPSDPDEEMEPGDAVEAVNDTVNDGYDALDEAGVAIDVDNPGFEPAELEKAHTSIDDEALQGYQMGLSQLSRQYAMAGMTGSGAEIAANNAMLAQIYDKALQQHRSLDLANLAQIETDLQEKVTNWQNQGQALIAAATAGQQISTQQVQDWMNSVKFINEEVVTSIMNMIDWTGHVPTGQTLSALQNVMLGAQEMLASGASIQEVTEWAQGQLDVYGIGLHKPGWGSSDDGYGVGDFVGDVATFAYGGPVAVVAKNA